MNTTTRCYDPRANYYNSRQGVFPAGGTLVSACPQRDTQQNPFIPHRAGGWTVNDTFQR